MLISALLMITLRYTEEDFDWFGCSDPDKEGGDCFGILAGFRASFALFLFHVLILIMIFPRAACSSALHDGFWGIKFVILIAVYVLTYFIPYKFFSVWAHICLWLSFFFLCIQAYFILNLAYTWNDMLMEAMNGRDGTSYAQFLLLCYSILNSVGCVVFLVFQFIWFTGGECESGLSMFILIATVFFCVFFWVSTLVRLCNVEIFRDNATIFVSSLVNTYICWLSWTALSSNPDETCNPFYKSGVNTVMQTLAAVVVTCITITSIATASVSEADKKSENTKSAGNAIIAEDVEGDAKAEDAQAEEAAIFPVTIPTLVFQIVMLFVTFYYGMLFTNWGNVTLDSETTENIWEGNMEYVPMWIKIIAQWLTIALFTVSITLKICCEDRVL